MIRERRVQTTWTTLFAFVTLISIVSGQANAAGDVADRYQQLRSTIESQLKPEYNNALAAFTKAAQANAQTRGNANDPHEMETATDFIKDMFYNKAYVLYRCLKDGASTKGSPEEKWDQAQACYKASSLLIIKAYKIVSDYPSWPWEAKCEFNSRLFDAEVEFPPFDFLRETTGSNRLLDHNRLIECILSEDHH